MQERHGSNLDKSLELCLSLGVASKRHFWTFSYMCKCQAISVKSSVGKLHLTELPSDVLWC